MIEYYRRMVEQWFNGITMHSLTIMIITLVMILDVL